jgi:hypothetical protein
VRAGRERADIDSFKRVAKTLFSATTRAAARKESLGIGLFARGGKAQLRSMEVWPMTPISPDRMTS